MPSNLMQPGHCDVRVFWLLVLSRGRGMAVRSIFGKSPDVEKAVEYVLLGQDREFSLND